MPEHSLSFAWLPHSELLFGETGEEEGVLSDERYEDCK
jgi:hypothetical protein